MPTPFQILIHHFFPHVCLGCDRAIWGDAAVGLCVRCFGGLKRWPEPSCDTCGRPFAGRVPPGFRCVRCHRKPKWDRALSVWVYRPPLDAVMKGLKFRRLEYLAPDLGSRAVTAIGGRLPAADVVVPVPLHWTRRMRRGFDQAELIAASVARLARLPCERLLRRRRMTAEQSRLPRSKREKNLDSAFVARYTRRERIRSRRILLVDDVMTTGATVAAAAKVLRQAGAAKVCVLAIARTPDSSW